jgi:PAS domain S-box-containing protein
MGTAGNQRALTSLARRPSSRAHALPLTSLLAERCLAVFTNPFVVHVVAAFLAYYVAGKLGQATTNIRSGNLGPVWPASGIALAAFLAYGYRVWPGVLASAFVVAFQSPVYLVTAVGQAAGATVAAMAGTFLLRRAANFDPAIARLRDALRLIVFGAFAGGAVSASIGVLSMYATRQEAYSGLPSAWLIYWLGDATGVLLVTPLVFTLPRLVRALSGRRAKEFAVLLTLLAAACFLVFGDLPLIPVRLHVLAFGVLPFVMWAAIGFGIGGASLSVFLIATIATLLTALGWGPFSTSTPFVNAVLLDVLFTVLAVSGLALAAVIAERERSEAERQYLARVQTEMEARLPLAAIVESSNEAIMSITVDGTIMTWNAAAQRMFGFSATEAIGRSTSILVPPGLRDENTRMLHRVGAGKQIAFETVRITKAAEKLHVSVTISPLRDEHGTVVGAATIVRDITDRKQADEALASVSRRLIEAQEQERRRIARELHDDIGQRLALLTVHLGGLVEERLSLRLKRQAIDLQRQADEIAADVQALSHQLHSSRLELLGIAPAMRRFCEEFAERHKMTVPFESHELPDRLPSDLSLCLFRILQEGLQNAAKHSGVRQFSVRLWGTQGRIHLLIRDQGRGFDVAAARMGRGIGLVSMEERIKLFDGDLWIGSQLGRGTTIHARVRFSVPLSSARPSKSPAANAPQAASARPSKSASAKTPQTRYWE